MTKLKNTKKGMAKKALSISLVAAMLATSNVPVWAAEDLFSDGSAAVEAPAVEEPAAEVDTFSAEPVEETNTNDVATYAATTNATITQSNWDTIPTVEGVIVDNEGNTVTNVTYEWLVDGKQPVNENGQAISGWNRTSTDIKDGITGIINCTRGDQFKLTANNSGHTLTLHIMGYGKDAGFDYTTPGITINPVDISEDISISFAEKEYTGQPITYNANEITVDGASQYGLTSEDFIYTYQGDHTNATIDLDIQPKMIATVNKEGYTGETSANFSIGKRTIKSEDLEISLNTKEVAYPGTLLSSMVTVKNKVTNEIMNPSVYKVDGTFSNNEAALTATFTDVLLTKDTTTAKNYKIVSGDVSTVATSEKIKMVPRNLNDCEISIDGIKYDKNMVSDHNKLVEAVTNNISFKADNQDITTDMLKAVTITVSTIKEGDTQATVTITSKDDSKVIGSITKNVRITINSFEDVSASNILSYTVDGKELKISTDGNSVQLQPETYTGEKITKKISSIKVGTTTLTSDEYDIVYTNDNVNAYQKSDEAVVVTLVGKGTWSGDIVLGKFVINQATIKNSSVTVPKTVEYNGAYTTAAEYMNGKVTVKAETTVDGKTTQIDVPEASYKLSYSIDGDGTLKVDNNIITNIESKDKNFAVESLDKKTAIGKKDISDESTTVEVVGGPYTYTGKAIEPELKVIYNGVELRKDKDYEILSSSNNVNAGNASVTIKGKGDFSGTKSASFTINQADINDVEIKADIKAHESDFTYDGEQIKPSVDSFDITLNGVDVSSNFTIAYPISSYDNVDAGTGKGTLTVKSGTSNFAGTKEFTFEILQKQLEGLTGTISAWDADGKLVDLASTENGAITEFYYDGNVKEFKEIKFTPTGSFTTLKEGVDYEVKYFNNTTGPVAAIYVNAIGNYTNPKDQKFTGSEQTYSKAAYFGIEGVSIHKENVKVNDSVYGGGTTVKPNVTITVGGRTLIEGTDYKFEIDGKYDCVNVTPANTTLKATIVPLGGYKIDENAKNINWKIVAQDLKNTKITATKADGSLNVTVMNGSVQVPTSEYDVKDNGDGTVTVTAKSTSKNYTGSQTVTLVDEDTSIGTPIITDVQVSGNKATVVLAGECDGATGYDYVISTVNDYENGRLANGINKNQLTTQTSYQYLNQGIYYAYCHAWKRVNGVKVFSEWSNIMPFSVSSITPDQPSITKIEKSSNGKHLRVTWTKSANATGYDVVMGTKLQKVNGEYRPTEYGKAVKKITNGDTVSVIFYNIPKGTYYVGLHAYNRTSETGVKVFSPWSNSKKVTF